MKIVLTALFCCLFVLAGRTQDTIASYFTLKGESCDYSRAAYFSISTLQYALYDTTHYAYREGAFPMAELGVKEGSYLFLDSLGNLREAVTFHNDLREGKSLVFYTDQSLKDEEWFEAGKLNGKCVYYFPNGKLAAVEHYTAGSLVSFEAFDRNGNPDPSVQSTSTEAQFPGGIPAMKQFLGEQLVYPKQALEQDIQGKVMVQFVVNEHGEVTSVKVKKGVPGCPECDQEALRVIRLMPHWQPAMEHNRPVKSYFQLPITFRFQTASEKKAERKKRRE